MAATEEASTAPRGRPEESEGEEEEEEAMAVLDFDMLCASVAMSAERRKGAGMAAAAAPCAGTGEGAGGGVQRMWEGDVVIDCLEDRRIALEAACCPCYRFGKNMQRANLGSCFLQPHRASYATAGDEPRRRSEGEPRYPLRSDPNSRLHLHPPIPNTRARNKAMAYFISLVTVLVSLIAFSVTRHHVYLYMGLGSVILIAIYTGYSRRRIRKQFNILGTDSSVDDCVLHLICPCCTLCQEARTLEMNNVQCGVWHGRGDTICLGSNGEGNKAFAALHKSSFVPIKSPELCSMERISSGADEHQPLVPSVQLEQE